MLTIFGVVPGIYVLYLSFVDMDGGFAGLQNYITVAQDFRYLDSLLHISYFAAVFVIPLLVVCLVISLLLAGRGRRKAAVLQVAYFIPNGLVGAAGVVLWMFLLTPGVSPIGPLLRLAGAESFYNVVAGENLVYVFATIAIWASGSSVLIFYSAFKGIPEEIIEAATVDGATPSQIAWYIKIPMVKRWIAFVGITAVTASLQIFVEPQLISGIAVGVAQNWSPLQLAYTFAVRYGNLQASAALSVEILLAGLVAAIVLVRFGRLTTTEI